jgi:hypothetical protein
MAVIDIKPKDVIIPFDVAVMFSRKLNKIELEKFNEALKKHESENKDKEKNT